MSRGLREGRLANVSAAVLLGGTSSRMGEDKAARPFAGEPAATRISRLLDGLFEDVLLVGGAAPPGARGRLVADGAGERSALRGLVAALAAAHTPRVLVVATDLVLLDAELVLALVAWPEADVVLPRRSVGIEPLCAIWRREPVVAAARAQLAAGRFALHELVGTIDARFLEGSALRGVDPDERALANANTPAEWSRLEAATRDRALPR